MSIRVLLIVFCLTIFAGPVAAQGEDAAPVLRQYFASLQDGDFAKSAGFFHPDALSEFRSALSFWKEIPEDSQQGFLDTFFGAGSTAESVDAKSDQEFFAAFLTAVMQQAQAAGSLNFDGMEILGAVPEGEKVLHYVTRNRVSVGEIQVEGMEVVSTQRTDAGWLLQLSGQMKGIAQQLKAAFASGAP